MRDECPQIESVLHYLIAHGFEEQQHTLLEQAGSSADERPGIHRLFIDLPFRAGLSSPEDDAGALHRAERAPVPSLQGMAMKYLSHTAGENHRLESARPDTPEWRRWRRHPSRARVWFVKAGPSQGKSTVGQFFCQIQRASLILQDEIPVDPKLYQLAQSVRERAEQEGFWTSTPRIPISIELKDYAQWISSRSLDDARGILTYLASRISRDIEAPVSTTALRRALGTRSWFVAFDGLDEVPSDTKEDVARGVRRFLGNEVAQSRADLLALCTSRPQGYSGQFADLDGPTIELSPLSPEQALSCARPVIGISRTPSEAAQAMSVLHSALESESVRELMTTPLQSHIMAVVVRDGGRPPERRWQLFSNFYQVIRKRESNRSLPDAPLARLLREDEQLLKTVHNRLGWMLHARAETSGGAQTDLHRDDFKRLVEQAAEQMIEGDVESTVRVLMEATTDRLVLVSTPDDGDHVRFHIRPLQEFFAAEFLLESSDAEQLRERLQVLAGDAHWREVVHFLLSALVETKRKTELSVAVDVLRRLNQSEEEGDESDLRLLRLLRLRLGRGAIIAARLMQEGVLEQDKRVRDQFRDILKPLTSITQSWILWPLVEVEQPNSRRWLLSFLLETMREATYGESVGAAIVLAQMLEDGDEMVSEVREFFLKAPHSYLSFVIESLEPMFYNEDGSAPLASDAQQWLLGVMLQLLLRPDWFQLSAEAIKAILTSVRERMDDACALAEQCGWSDEEIALLCTIAPVDRVEERSESRSTDYGLVKALWFEHDWTAATFEEGAWTVESLQSASGSRGIMEFTRLELLFGSTKQLPDLHAAVEVLNDAYVDRLQVLPRYIQAYLPLNSTRPDGWAEGLRALKTLDDQGLESLRAQGHADGYRCSRPAKAFQVEEEDCTLEQWKALLQHVPSFMLRLLIAGERRVIEEERQQAIDAAIDELLQRPELLPSIVLSWGRLLEISGERSQELRRLMREAASAPVARYHSPGHTSTPLLLDLPSEAPLIPHFLSAFTGQVLSGGRFSNAEAEEVEAEIEELKFQLQQRSSDALQLKSIAQDSAQPLEVRACAAMMFLLHPQGDKYLQPWQGLLVEASRPEINAWYLRAVVVCLRLVASEEDRAARLIVGGLLERTRGHFEHTQQIQRLLGIWREASHAPITKAGVQDVWLAS